MLGVVEDTLDWTRFNNVPQMHDSYIGGHACNNAHIVCNEQDTHIALLGYGE